MALFFLSDGNTNIDFKAFYLANNVKHGANLHYSACHFL